MQTLQLLFSDFSMGQLYTKIEEESRATQPTLLRILLLCSKLLKARKALEKVYLYIDLVLTQMGAIGEKLEDSLDISQDERETTEVLSEMIENIFCQVPLLEQALSTFMELFKPFTEKFVFKGKVKFVFTVAALEASFLQRVGFAQEEAEGI